MPKYVYARCIQELLAEMNQTTRTIHPRILEYLRLGRIDGKKINPGPYHATIELTLAIEAKSIQETEPSVASAFAAVRALGDAAFDWEDGLRL